MFKSYDPRYIRYSNSLNVDEVFRTKPVLALCLVGTLAFVDTVGWMAKWKGAQEGKGEEVLEVR